MVRVLRWHLPQMSSHPTKRLWCSRRPGSSQPAIESRSIPINSVEGPARYFGRPLYFGPFHPDALDELFECKVELERAEACDKLGEALALLGLESREQWWHIEASFFARHLADLDDPAARQRELICRARRRRARGRRVDGTPAPLEIPEDPPVTFEVYCELSGARTAWADRGLDPVAEAVAYFVLEAGDLVDADLYWSHRLAADRTLARRFARTMQIYRDEFAAG